MTNQDRMNNVFEKIKLYGNKSSCYVPFVGGACYPLWSMDFIRTGFMDISFTLSARDYKDPKCVIIEDA